MVKVKIRRKRKKTKPIRILSRKPEIILRRKPIVINFIPPKKKKEPAEEKNLEYFGDLKPEAGRGLIQGKQEADRRGLLQGRPGMGGGLEQKYGIKGAGDKLLGKIRLDAEKTKRLTGIPFPRIKSEIVPLPKKFKRKELKIINLKYPLIPKNPKRGEEIFAYAHIFWNKKTNELIYNVIEPKITKKEKLIIEDIKRYISEKIDIDFAAIKRFEARNYLFKKIDDAIEYFRLNLSDTESKIFKYYIFRDFLGLERIEPILQDDNLEDISCNGVGVPMYVVHRDSRFGSLRTNIYFETFEELDSFVMKLAQKCGRDISVAQPLLDGILPDNSRVQATLATDIARRGSNFTIRKFNKDPFTPVIHILSNTCDVKLMTYLWFAIENGRSVLIAGGTASGKTSLLNSISMFIKPQEKIVTIEDTGELQLPHPNWVPEVAREVMETKGYHSVTLFDLLRESLRQRPNRIIVGEVRGKEAYVLFQAMATGHPGLATIHAESMDTLIDRLTTEPINLPASLLETLDIIIFISQVHIGDRKFRRIVNIEEVGGMDFRTNRPVTNVFSRWEPKTDTFKIVNKSIILKKILDLTGKSKKEIEEDIINKSKVLEYLSKEKITDYVKIGNIIAEYTSSPERFLRKIGLR
ncbi:MAG: type IV secretion system protein VirB11 [Candidatus Aenigmarchaeota archaeon ex4484_56]|nr:MAG: type IV secretion system protein VirB11 [Candidatus Aenigmarchaeota archaeon ex4484_56]